MDRFEARKAALPSWKKSVPLLKSKNVSTVLVTQSVLVLWLSHACLRNGSSRWTNWPRMLLPTKTQKTRLNSTHLVSNDTFLQWMENVHDWVISRQLWWGHQIPAWYNAEGEIYVGEEAPEGDGWTQDEDVLDTWFSSALWPFSTMGWPDVDSEDFKRYYPTSTLVTGYDIIPFWVSRMIFQGLEFTGKSPFKNAFDSWSYS